MDKVSRILLTLVGVGTVALGVTVATAGPTSTCDVVGTWEAAAFRINGGEMGLASENNRLIFNTTHWARVEAFQGEVIASAGTYEVNGDSLVWQYEFGGDHRLSEACQVDSTGLHLVNDHGTNQDGTPTLRETDYRRVE